MTFADIVLLGFITIVWFGICTMLTVLIHETGHLVFGKLSGYTLTGFAVAGLMIRKGKLERYPAKRLSFGQCFMCCENEDRDPRKLIAGGCIVNLVLGCVLTLTAILTLNLKEQGGVWRLMFLTVPALINIVMGSANLFGGSAMSDGNTLKDVKAVDGKQMYNRVMMITSHLLDGRAFSEMPEGLFRWNGDRNKCSLAAEISMYAYYRRFEKTEDIGKLKSLMQEYKFDRAQVNDPIFADEEEVERKIWQLISGSGSQYSEIVNAEARYPRELVLQSLQSGMNEDRFNEVLLKLEKPMSGLARSARFSRTALIKALKSKDRRNNK